MDLHDACQRCQGPRPTRAAIRAFLGAGSRAIADTPGALGACLALLGLSDLPSTGNRVVTRALERLVTRDPATLPSVMATLARAIEAGPQVATLPLAGAVRSLSVGYRMSRLVPEALNPHGAAWALGFSYRVRDLDLLLFHLAEEGPAAIQDDVYAIFARAALGRIQTSADPAVSLHRVLDDPRAWSAEADRSLLVELSLRDMERGRITGGPARAMARLAPHPLDARRTMERLLGTPSLHVDELVAVLGAAMTHPVLPLSHEATLGLCTHPDARIRGVAIALLHRLPSGPRRRSSTRSRVVR